MIPKPSVYLETSIISYLCSRPSRDIIVAAYQQITSDWWNTQRFKYELFVSHAVLSEVEKGDTEAVKIRLQVINPIKSLELTREADALAHEWINRLILPSKAYFDALHIAIAVENGIDYLLTWNCAHIANAKIKYKIEAICYEKGYNPPVICTPGELMEELE